MSLTPFEIYRISQSIVSDLFQTTENTIYEREQKLAYKNLQIRIDFTGVDKVPPAMLPQTRKYLVYLRDKQNPSNSKYITNRIIKYTLDVPFVSPFIQDLDKEHECNAFIDEIFPELHSEAENLRKDIHKIQTDKSTIQEYFAKTARECKDYQQLLDAWPQILHPRLEIPAQYIRRLNTQKPDSEKEFPVELKQRLLTALLDGECTCSK